jgi:hypothetical protein
MLGFQNARDRSKIDKPNPSDTAARRLGHCETCAPSSRWKVRLAIHCRSGLTAKSPASAGSLPSPDPRCYLYVTLTKSTWSPPKTRQGNIDRTTPQHAKTSRAQPSHSSGPLILVPSLPQFAKATPTRGDPSLEVGKADRHTCLVLLPNAHVG